MTPSQIQKQAISTVAAEYAPVYSSIQQQQQQAIGLADKRNADNEAYQSWLGAQTGALESARTSQNTALGNVLNSISQAQNNLYGGNVSQTLTDQANARMGNVSNNAASNLIGTAPTAGGTSYIGSMEQSARGLVDSATQLGANNGLVTNDLLAATGANDQAVLNNNTKVNGADLQTTLNKLADTLSTDQQKETGAVATEYSNLYDKQVSLAENNRNFAMTEALDGVKIADTQNQIAARNQATADRNQTTADTNAKTQGTLGLDAVNAQRINATTKYTDARAQALQNGGAVTKAEKLAEQKAINIYAGKVNDLLSSARNPDGSFMTAGQLRNLWQYGGQYYVRNSKGALSVTSITGHSGSDYAAWAGFQTSNAGKGLTQDNVNALKQNGYGTLGYSLAPGTRNALTQIVTPPANTRSSAQKAATKSQKGK